jgi:HAD superfamily phosphatase (TIGR01668 family)
LADEKKPRFSFRPDYIAESVADIDYPLLIGSSITTCFIDLDNTVVERGMYAVEMRVIRALSRSGLDVYIATNRPKSRDLKNLRKDLNAKGVIHPHGIFAKPMKRYYMNALRDLNLQPHEVVMIGDRYLQDMFGANLAGIYSLLVHKVGGPKGIFDKLFTAIDHWLTRRYTRIYLR